MLIRRRVMFKPIFSQWQMVNHTADDTMHTLPTPLPNIFTQDILPVLKHLERAICPPFCRLHFHTRFLMKMFKFRLVLKIILFLKDQLIISHHWIRWWLGTEQATSHYLHQWWLSLLKHICVFPPQLTPDSNKTNICWRLGIEVKANIDSHSIPLTCRGFY